MYFTYLIVYPSQKGSQVELESDSQVEGDSPVSPPFRGFPQLFQISSPVDDRRVSPLQKIHPDGRTAFLPHGVYSRGWLLLEETVTFCGQLELHGFEELLIVTQC